MPPVQLHMCRLPTRAQLCCRPSHEEAQQYVQLEQRAHDLLSATIASIAASKPWLDAIRPGAAALVRPSDTVSTELAVILGTTQQLEAIFAEVHGTPVDTRWRQGVQSADATVFVLSLHEAHPTDTTDARSTRKGAAPEDFAGFRRVQKKWAPPALPMCAATTPPAAVCSWAPRHAIACSCRATCARAHLSVTRDCAGTATRAASRGSCRASSRPKSAASWPPAASAATPWRCCRSSRRSAPSRRCSARWRACKLQPKVR